MIRYSLLFFLCMAFGIRLHAQGVDECVEIKVEARVSLDDIYLDFSSGFNYNDFNLFLFADKRADNRLNFTAKEIKDLPKGNYLLVIQEKNGDKFCAKKINLKIE